MYQSFYYDELRERAIKDIENQQITEEHDIESNNDEQDNAEETGIRISRFKLFFRGL